MSELSQAVALSECIWCRGEVEVLSTGVLFYVSCADPACTSLGPFRTTEESALGAWEAIRELVEIARKTPYRRDQFTLSGIVRESHMEDGIRVIDKFDLQYVNYDPPTKETG